MDPSASRPPVLRWKDDSPKLKIEGDWELALQSYFAQERELTGVELELLTPGRAGASVVRGYPTARRGGRETRLQPELVKFGNLERTNLVEEVQNFKLLAEHTELVHGQAIARPLYVDPKGQIGVFSYRLLESGTSLSAFYAVALTRPDDAGKALNELLDRLIKWYGHTQNVQNEVPWSVRPDRIEQALQHLTELDSRLAADLGELVRPERWRDVRGNITRVHNDLHAENILIPRSGNLAYLIDFGSANAAGSACMDIARLESDLIYRLLPLDLTPKDLAKVERTLATGNLAEFGNTVAGWLVSLLRTSVSGLLSSPNGAAWFLLGRVLSGLRMLTGTWPEVIPYGDANRRMGIVASLRELTRQLTRALDGATLSPLKGTMNPKAPAVVVELDRSLTTMYVEREYKELFQWASAVVGATSKPSAAVTLLGLLGGVSANLPIESLMELEKCLPARITKPREKGINRLYEGVKGVSTGA